MRFLILILGAALLGYAECSIEPLEAGTPADSTLPPDCKGQELLPPSITAAITDVKPLTMKAFSIEIGEGGSVLTASVTSDVFPPFFLALREDRSLLAVQVGSATAAAFQISLNAGKYLIVVGSRSVDAAGAFRLETSTEALRDCGGTGYIPGETISGELTDSDCRELDVIIPSTSQRRVDVYNLSITDWTVMLFQINANFPPAMALINAADGRLIENGQSNNSGVQFAQFIRGLPPGDYKLLATSGAVVAGAYAFRTLFETGRTCREEALGLPGNAGGALASNDCRVIDYLPFETIFAFTRVYKIEVPTRSLVTIDLTSLQVDSYLTLAREDKTVIAEDDSSGGGRNSRIAVTLKPGTYLVLASSASDEEIGTFQVRTTAAEPRACAVEELQPSTTMISGISGEDCRIREMIDEEPAGFLGRQFTVTLEKNATMAVEMSAIGFIPGAILRDSQGRFITFAPQTAPAGTTRGTRDLAAGTYTLFALSLDSRPGEFTLRYELQ